MKNFGFLIIVLFLSVLSFSQTKSSYFEIDNKISKIPNDLTSSTIGIAAFIDDNFKTDSEKIRAVFYWTVSNISYDVPNMLAPNNLETKQEKIEKTLRTKKGVCIHYAEVFNDISNKIGIKCRVIDGYTKQNGKVANVAHAWCAAEIEGKWFVFDPTWGSGFVNNGKYFKKINDTYFKTEPYKIISSHMPFDYMWQFLNYPITNTEFYSGKTQIDKSKNYFDFEKEIARYDTLSETDQLFETADRTQKNGLKNNLIAEYYDGKKKNWTVLRQNGNIKKLNTIVTEVNQAIVLLNDFIMYRNKKFKPTFSDEVISDMIQNPKDKLVKCQNDIFSLGTVGSENTSNVISLKNTIAQALIQAEEQVAFVKDYMSKSKLVRKTMFTKVSWFGVPLN